MVHAGFWGTFVPAFDDLTSTAGPADIVPATGVLLVPGTPRAVPDPCLALAAWTANDRDNLIGIPVQAYNTAPGACVTNKLANTDVLVVRHAETCVAGVGTCEADTAGKLYFQSELCETGNLAQGGSANSLTLAATASDDDDHYNGVTIRIIDGQGKGQTGVVASYDGATKVATMAAGWGTPPDNTSRYEFANQGYTLGTSGFFHGKRDCATAADKRKYVSSIYYIRNFATTAGDGIPTLVRSSFDTTAGGAQALIEGIDGFNVELGIDNFSETGAPVDYTLPVAWADPATKKIPTNRGDGAPDAYVSCGAGCTVDQLRNAVAVKIYVLARAREATPGHVDTKTYNLGSVTRGPFNDGFKRHVFATTVRLANVSGRRETP